MGGWSRRRKVLTFGGAALVLWLLVVAYLLGDAWLSMHRGTEALRDVRGQADVSALLRPRTRDQVQTAQREFSHASGRLDSFLLAPIRIVPVASRHLAAVRHVAHGSRDGATAAQRSLADLDALVDRPHGTGAQRLQLLRDLAGVAQRASADLGRIDPGSSASLASPVGKAVDELRSQRDDARRGADRLRSVSLAIADVLEGPEPYLLLGANNAEMRNDGGMFLSAATLAAHGGSLDLGPVRPTAETILPAKAVPVTGDLARNWSWLDPGRDLRNLGLSADFPQSARLAVANWAKVPGGAKTAGVIVVDVDAIRSLLRVVGPVTVDGVRYTPDNVRELLLRDQYRRFGSDRGARRDQLGAVARRIFDLLQHGNWKVDRLATELSDAVQGRHILVWSVDPKVQRAWHTVGADGHLTSSSVSVALLNRAADKLDSWVDTAADVTFAAGPKGRTRVSITYRIDNTCTAANCSGPPYVIGPNVAGLGARDHRGLVVANLPGGTTDIVLKGTRQFLAAADGPTQTVGGEVTVRSGRSAVVTITGLLPEGITDLVVEPSARIDHTEWTVEGRTFDRDRRRTVTVPDLGG